MFGLADPPASGLVIGVLNPQLTFVAHQEQDKPRLNEAFHPLQLT
jgi:hypothetical protein